MYSFFVGIDVSKSVIDVAYYASGKAIYLASFTNSIQGFKEMYRMLRQQSRCRKHSWFVCFENTGVYSKTLLTWLLSQQIACSGVPPIFRTGLVKN
jgi:transposase